MRRQRARARPRAREHTRTPPRTRSSKSPGLHQGRPPPLSPCALFYLMLIGESENVIGNTIKWKRQSSPPPASPISKWRGPPWTWKRARLMLCRCEQNVRLQERPRHEHLLSRAMDSPHAGRRSQASLWRAAHGLNHMKFGMYRTQAMGQWWNLDCNGSEHSSMTVEGDGVENAGIPP